LSFLSVFFLILQGLIGAAAVVWGQSDFVLALHFGISLISFAAVFLLTLLIFEVDKKFDATSLHIKPNHRKEIYALTIYTIIVDYIRALVRFVSSNLVCRICPFCSIVSPFVFGHYSLLHLILMVQRLLARHLYICLSIFIV